MSEIILTSEITVRLIQSVGNDGMVVAAAKVSTSGDDAMHWALERHKSDNAGLINFLMAHRHGTPFEHGSMTFFVKAPIFAWREHHRHRIGWSYNEESARYKPLDPVFWVPRRDRRMCPVDGWKPGRPKFRTLDQGVNRGEIPYSQQVAMADTWHESEINRKRAAYTAAYSAYRESIDDGIAMEVARSVLPVGIYSSCWTTCNPRSLMAFLSLRTHDPDARFPSYPQAEIEEIARQYEAIFAEGWPITYAAFCRNGRVGP